MNSLLREQLNKGIFFIFVIKSESKLKRFIIYILFLVSFIPANATHIAGADLTYKCLGGNDYLITFTFYRDCSGVEAPDNLDVSIESSCYDPFNLTLYRIDSTGTEVTPTCSSQVTSCKGGNLYGLQQFIYQAQVILPPCEYWLMYYYLCCRNYSNTIINSQGTGMYIPAMLNNLDAPRNSSPRFTNIPVTILCEGETFCFNHGAIDIDGDSLSYSLVTPYDRGPDGSPPNVIYASDFTAEQPFPSDPPININPVTGDICMSPSANIIAPMAVLINEYRNGIKIGSVLRDMQVNVIYCDNHLPRLSGISSNSSVYDSLNTKYSDTVCVGKTIDFKIYAFDPDTNNISITWNKAIKGAEFTVTNNHTPEVNAAFKWTPSGLDLRNAAYCFTATVADESCPYVGSQTYSFCIYVKGFKVSIGTDTSLCKGEKYRLFANTDTNVVNFKWTLDGNPVALADTSKHFVIQTNDLNEGIHSVGVAVKDKSQTVVCPGYAYANINVVNNPVVKLPDTIAVCEGKDALLDAGVLAKRFLWNTGDTSRSIIVNSAGDYYVMADGGYGTRCIVFDTVNVRTVLMPAAIRLGKDTCILNSQQNIVLDAGDNAQIFKYKWSNGKASQRINVTETAQYAVTVSSEPGSQCYSSDSVIVNVLKPNFLGTDIITCNDELISLSAPENIIGKSFLYKWLPSGLTTQKITLKDLVPGLNPIYLQVYGGCEDSLIVNVKVCNLKVPDVLIPASSNGNNKFKIKDIEYFPGSRLVVFNRWGEKVFEKDNYEDPFNWWDGNNQPAGVYFYVLILPGKDSKQGSVTILR